MSDSMRIPTSTARAETTARNSRFIAQAAELHDAAGVKERVEAIRAEHPGCRHVVYAFAIGDVKSVQHGMSDDGEPKGTAGRPVLEVLKGSGVTNVLVTIVRYFGGTKLGTGGLVRAYTEAAQLVLTQLPTRILVDEVRFQVEAPYELLEPVRRAVTARDGKISGEAFGESVAIHGRLPRSELPQLSREVAELSRGSLQIVTGDEDSGKKDGPDA